ncbi:glycosyltransferase [Olivibacter sitiensis]|uniref:glycosyltransferase n=1 Tax=Olivibacter sitiensis TaxID=376470 RepID=UPI00041DC9EE|nr:glycosyltransferase [Olivibacter sitiensis]
MMKITFICGSMQPGKDGVGDYTRRLAAALIKLGHQASVIALYDKEVRIETSIEQEQEGVTVPVLRLPFRLSWNKKKIFVENWLNEYDPDWLSLQYVPYSFSKKGIPIFLGNKLSAISDNIRWHVMVHEPFLGLGKSVKSQIIRVLQIYSLKSLGWNLNPIFHTSIFHYKAMIDGELNIDTKIMGLFGNIPLSNVENHSSRLKKKTSLVKTGVYFGSAPPPRHFDFFMSKINAYHNKYGVAIRMILCGDLGVNGKDFELALKSSLLNRGIQEIEVLGRIPSYKIADVFRKVDFGISRVPTRLLGKSGSTISMLEHGLPVWFPVVENTENQYPIDYRRELCFFDLDDLQELQKKNFVPENRLLSISSRFVKELTAHAEKQNEAII